MSEKKKETTPLDENSPQVDVLSLFERATTDLNSVGQVSDHVRIGKRWDFTHKDLIDQVIVLKRGKAIKTKYGDAILAEIDFKGRQVDVLLGGTVLIDIFPELAPHLPVICVIRRPARSYIFDDATPAEKDAYVKAYL